MTYVIAEPCIGTKDTACVEVCPVDCIHPVKDAPDFAKFEMLYINPDECIDCDACVPECPWEAIYAEADVPAQFKDDTALNKLCMDAPDAFKKAVNVDKPQPSADEVEANKTKWGL